MGEAAVDLNSVSKAQVQVSGRKGKHGIRTALPREGDFPEAPQVVVAAQVCRQQENRAVEVSGRKGKHGIRTALPHEGDFPEATQVVAAAQVCRQQENRAVRPREADVAEAPQVCRQQEKEETGLKTSVVTQTRVWRSADMRGAAQGAGKGKGKDAAKGWIDPTAGWVT